MAPASGHLVQIDAPDLAMERARLYQNESLDRFLEVVELHVKAINRVRVSIPADRIRLHICWGNYERPHTHDVPLAPLLPILYRAKVGALSIEMANPRPAHEWNAIKRVGFPEHRVLLPGVLDSTADQVEHPEVVADRIERAARTASNTLMRLPRISGAGSVSVVIPAFNPRIEWLRMALDSALGQIGPAVEVIVVDDGSTHDTSWIEAEYGLDVRVVRQVNGGPGSARNRGIRDARCPFVAFLDADDVWLPDKLALQLELYAQHPDAGLVYCDAALIDEVGNPRHRPIERRLASGLILEPLFRGNFIANSSVVMSRKCLDAVGGFSEDRALIGVEDYELWLRVAARFPIYATPNELIQYRVVMDGLSHKDPTTYKARERAVIRRTVKRHGADIPALREMLAPRVRDLYLQEVEICRAAGLCAEARSVLTRFLREYPWCRSAWRLSLRAFLIDPFVMLLRGFVSGRRD